MEAKSYLEKLKDPRWQKKRLEVLERDEWICVRCYDSESTLYVHHLTYEPNKDPWDYPLDNFITLCDACHAHEHEMRYQAERMLLKELQKRGFLADDLICITRGFAKLPTSYNLPDLTASNIEGLLSRDIIDRFPFFDSSVIFDISWYKREELHRND